MCVNLDLDGIRTTAACVFAFVCVHGVFSPNMPAGGVMRSNAAKMYRKLTLRVQGGRVINKEAWSYKLTTHLYTSCPSVFTHPLKKEDTSGRCANVYRAGIVRWWGKWQSHWRLRSWWSTGDFSCHGCILQRDVHSQGAWRRQEIYTESSGPKEGCTDPAQAPPVHVRWVKCHRAFDAASPRLS